MSRSYIVHYSIPDADTSARRSGYWQTEHLFFAYEDIICPPYVSDAGVPGSVYTSTGCPGWPCRKRTPALHSLERRRLPRESGPLALPRAHILPPLPGLLIRDRHLLPPRLARTVRHPPRRPAHRRNRHPRRRRNPDGALYSVCIEFHPTDSSACPIPRNFSPASSNASDRIHDLRDAPGPVLLSAGPLFAPPAGPSPPTRLNQKRGDPTLNRPASDYSSPDTLSTRPVSYCGFFTSPFHNLCHFSSSTSSPRRRQISTICSPSAPVPCPWRVPPPNAPEHRSL